MTPQEWRDITAAISSFWPQRHWTDDERGTWFSIFVDYTAAEVREVVIELAKKRDFPPSPASIIELLDTGDSSKYLGVDQAWVVVDKQFYRFDETMMPKIPQHPEVEEAIRLLGWPYMVNYPAKDIQFLRKQFAETYQTVVQRHLAQDRRDRAAEIESGSTTGAHQIAPAARGGVR